MHVSCSISPIAIDTRPHELTCSSSQSSVLISTARNPISRNRLSLRKRSPMKHLSPFEKIFFFSNGNEQEMQTKVFTGQTALLPYTYRVYSTTSLNFLILYQSLSIAGVLTLLPERVFLAESSCSSVFGALPLSGFIAGA